MKKVFAVAKVAAIVNVFLFFTLFITTCGGGAAGGAGGASIPDSEYSTHNAGGWGGGGSSGGSGGSSSGGNGVNMTGGTPLFVERYEDPVTGTFAGSQLNDLIAAIQNNSSRSNSVFNIPFYVVGDPVVRQARVTKGRTKVEKFEHQYKATCSIPPSTTTSVFYYYVEEGINLASITTAEMTGWQCQQDGSIHNGSHITNITGDVSLVPVYANGAGPINAGILKTDLHTAAIPDVGEIWDYAQQTGVQDGTAYITVPPPPMTALYNENGSAVTWGGNYIVNISIDGNTLTPLTFSSGDTQSKQITNIPVGATISASATINVTGSSRYASLTTPQLSTTIQAGGNLDMYFSYPYTCHIPSSLQSYTVVSGVNSGAYKNNGTPTDISSKRPTPESFEYNGQTLYFIGWSRNAADTVPEIAGDSIPANGTYHGALDLYAIFSSCSVSISPGGPQIIVEGSTLDITATPAGDLPENSSYYWTIENPSSNPPVSLPPGSGTPSVSNKSITVTPVTGRTGSATIKVTATDGVHSASKTIDVTVLGLTLTEGPIVLTIGETYDISAQVQGYGTNITYSWTTLDTSVSVTNIADSIERVTAVEGGKATITVTATIQATNTQLPPKTIDVYVFDLQLTGGTDTIVTDTPSSFPDADYDFIMDASRVSGGTLTANLAGFSPSEVSFTWENNATALGTFGTINSSGNSCTITPNGTTGWYVINLQASITGVAGTTKVFKVRYKTLGLQFTTSSPTAISKTAASAAEKTMTVEVNGYASVDSVTWGNWVSSVTSVASNGIETKINNTETATLVLNPEAGGITTVSMSATIGIGANTITLNATKDVYILDLQLNGDGVFNSTDTNIDYDFIKKASETTGVELTASLDGFDSGVTYEWTQPSSLATLSHTEGAENIITLNGTTGSTDFQLTASIDGVTGASITKTIKLKAAGITITGASSFVYDGTTQNYSISVSSDINLNGGTISYGEVNDTGNVASIERTGAMGIVTAAKGGTYTISASATVSGTSITLTATKTITILRPVIKQNGSAIANTTLDFGSSMDVTAELEGGLTASSWSWSKSSGSPAGDVTLSSTNIAGIQITGTTLGLVNVTATATYGGQQCSRTIQIEVKLTPDGLGAYLDNLGANSPPPAQPYVLPALTVSASDWTDIKTVLTQHPNVYVDLSATQLPNSITDMNQGFKDCKNLVIAPQMPASVTNMQSCFNGCTNLTTPPNLSACTSLSSMSGCFYKCSNLTTPPDLSACTSLTNMANCFSNCSKLGEDLSTMFIPGSVTDMRYCFYNCTSLKKAPVIPLGVTDMVYCFSSCSNLEGTITINASIANSTNIEACFLGCNVDKITKIKVPDPATKSALTTDQWFPSGLNGKVYYNGETGYDD
ncbi:MAG: leucine-rich repeat protein [Spirochaetaceae bacterium]|nr:leucine-rich repeat protein [Spirochaetaceae bacterium]